MNILQSLFMKNKFQLLFALLCIVPAFCLVSCSDDDDEEPTYKNLNGTLKVTGIPHFVRPGEKYTLFADGLHSINGEIINYCWSAEPVIEGECLYQSFPIEIPNKLTNFVVELTAYSIGYNDYTIQYVVTIVDPKRTVTGIVHDPEGGVFTDERDGKQYHYTSIAGLDWMDENLAYEAFGVPYDTCKVMTDVFGMYYTWEDAIKACPEGWRLPTEEDWKKLATSITGKEYKDYDVFEGVSTHIAVDAKFNGNELWTSWPQDPINNSTYLNILPVGYGTRDNPAEGYEYYFSGVEQMAAFWTATSYDDGNAIVRYIVDAREDEKSEVKVMRLEKDRYFLPIRLVRDSE